MLRAGTPRRDGLALQTAPRGTSLSPPPVSSPAVARALGDPARLQCPEGRGGAQRRRWAVTLSSFTSGSCSGCDGRVPGLGEEAGNTRLAEVQRSGPRVKDGFLLLGCHATHAFLHFPPRPTGSTPLSPEPRLLPSSRRLRGGCRPPERPRAAWAAGGASCEAAGRGLGCGLLRRRAVSQKCSCPSPHTPLSSHLAPHSFPLPPPRPSLSSPRKPQPGNRVRVHEDLREGPERGRRGQGRDSDPASLLIFRASRHPLPCPHPTPSLWARVGIL